MINILTFNTHFVNEIPIAIVTCYRLTSRLAAQFKCPITLTWKAIGHSFINLFSLRLLSHASCCQGSVCGYEGYAVSLPAVRRPK